MPLSFREYLLQRPRRYTATSSFVFTAMRDDEFAELSSREQLEAYLTRRNVAPNERLHAYAVWRSYLNAKKRGGWISEST